MKKLVTFRLDPDLLDKIRKAALAENRTLTNYVETMLKRAFDMEDDKHDRLSGPDLGAANPDLN